MQNIRAYDAEHRTVEELRRLSALRADFVSLVSHELRSPMAAVIGAAQTLQQRWRELSPDQRASFLALIADETSRLADLIADVLDTSRIEAGTFTYRFDDLDIGELTEEAVASASLGQDEVPIRAIVHGPLPALRGDRVRLRQVLGEPDRERGEVVATRARRSTSRSYALNGRVVVAVRDSGPGIARDEHDRDLREVRPREGRRGAGRHRPRPLHRALDRGGARRHASTCGRCPARARPSR